MAIITSSDLKTHLGISDTTDDTTIATAVAAANAAVVGWCGRTFDATTTASASARVYRPKSPRLVVTDDFWTTSGLVVKIDQGNDGTYETTLTLNSDFIVEPLNGIEDGSTVPYRRLRGNGWVFPPEVPLATDTYGVSRVFPSVQVTAAWGWASVPDEVKLATLVYAARLWKRKNSPEGVLGGFQDYGAVRISYKMDPDVTSLLEPFIRSESKFYT